MLGGSVQILNQEIARCVFSLKPKTVFEFGCGAGKFGWICNQVQVVPDVLIAAQKLFTDNDEAFLLSKGYTKILDVDISEFIKNGFDTQYDLIVGMDIIEHFMYGEAMSIIDYSLYNCDYFLLVWPSKFPQNLGDPHRDGNLHVASILDVHRTSFELSDICNRFDVVHYTQVNLSENPSIMRFHLAVLRGHVNTKPLFPPIGYRD